MKRFLPKSMAGQTIIVLLVGLTLSHIISMAIYSADRAEVLTLSGGRHMAHRIASITRLLNETPKEWRAQIVHATDSPSLAVTVTSESDIAENQKQSVSARLISSFLRQLVGGNDHKIFIQIQERTKARETHESNQDMHWQHMGMVQLFHGRRDTQTMRASVQLNDGQWVNFATPIPGTNPLWSSQAFFSMLLMALGVVLLSLWVIRRVTNPLRLFAGAAERLGKDVNTSPMEETGPEEIVFATRAFNDMQARLQRLIENRTRMLAAISHDLRTPITLMRLRAEYVENSEEREKMLNTLTEMEQMISSTLSFARDDTEKEPPETVDIGALITSITDDLVDMGMNVECKSEEGVNLSCRPVALRRAATNVIENAVKYGKSTVVEVNASEEKIRITISDDGPGIPQSEIDLVFSPFYRVDKSRNQETGGVGLGLSVAQTIINGHGGDITLTNRATGGLKVEITLPF